MKRIIDTTHLSRIEDGTLIYNFHASIKAAEEFASLNKEHPNVLGKIVINDRQWSDFQAPPTSIKSEYYNQKGHKIYEAKHIL